MRYRGLSESSVLKYGGAINGAMSECAINAGLIDGPLSTIQNHSRFEAIAASLRNLPVFQSSSLPVAKSARTQYV